MKPGRRDAPRRVTPDLLHFYIQRAHRLRIEAYRDIWRAAWAVLKKIGRRRSG